MENANSITVKCAVNFWSFCPMIVFGKSKEITEKALKGLVLTFLEMYHFNSCVKLSLNCISGSKTFSRNQWEGWFQFDWNVTFYMTRFTFLSVCDLPKVVVFCFFLVPDFHPAPNDFFLSFSKLPVSSQTPFFLQNPAAPFSPSLLHFPYM